MKTKLFSYQLIDSYVHRLSGLTKLLSYIMLTFAVMLTFDTRVVVGVLIFTFILLFTSKLDMKKIRLIMVVVITYLLINTLISFFFSPYYGVDLYGTRHDLFKLFGNIYVTQEQLFYEATKLLKYLSMIPLGLLFILTTNPSEFASSLNKVGVPYKVSYGFALTLRYFPDVQKNYVTISKSQQARGIEMTGKAPIMSRLKNAVLILMPLIFSSLDRVDSISNAMDLRGFGKHKKRTWYTSKKLTKEDYLALAVSLLILLISVYVSVFVNQSRFYNPFI